MKRNQYLRRGLTLAGFEGGWLEEAAPEIAVKPGN
jgi:hypothetical protein